MNFKKISGSFLIVLLIVFTVFGQQLKMKQNGNVVSVTNGRKTLYKVALKGNPNQKLRRYDEAFMAGSCLIVRRDVLEDELFPLVSQVEIYQTDGKKQVYFEKDLAIRRLSGFRVFNSSDFSWAIILDTEEGLISGYFYISPQCRLSGVSFKEGEFDTGGSGDELFIDAATFKIPFLLRDRFEEKKKRIDLFITKDGKYRIADAEK